MKRFIFLILTVCLCATITLSGCSCTGDAVLEFNSSKVKNIQAERLTYSVSLEKNYKDIKRSTSLNQNLLPEYKNGVYVAEYQAGVNSPVNHINLSQSESVINRITTSLTIEVVDNKGTADTSDDKIYKDQILSEVYFYDSSWSYAPIYSKTTVKNTYVANDSSRIEYAHKIYQYTATYKKSSYVLTKKYYSPSDGEDITGDMNLNELDPTKFVAIKGNGSSHEYEFRQVLDNVQLIFATRNLDISKGKSIVLPVVSYMYSSPSQLQLLNSANSTKNIDKQSFNYSVPTYNNFYAESTLSIPVKNIRITLTNTDYIGLPKYVVVQNGTADEEKINNNALIVEYAEAIVASASYNCLGALVYRLNDVSISYNA